jgi:hypothetical protein
MLLKFCFNTLLTRCKGIIQRTTNANDELKNRFLAQDVMDAFEKINPQYWSKWIAKETFLAHVILLEAKDT